jgi:hypothetical protein
MDITRGEGSRLGEMYENIIRLSRLREIALEGNHSGVALKESIDD